MKPARPAPRYAGMKQPASPTRSSAQRAAIVLACIVQIGSTFLPQFGLGEPIGERSDAIRTLITPAGYAFAIWGPLFLGSAVFAIWQALPGQRDDALCRAIGWPAALALSMQGVWAIYTQFAALDVVSVAIILASLAGLLLVLRTLAQWPRFTQAQRWIIALPFSALAAWLTAASIVNISAALAFYGWGGNFSQPLIAALMVVTGAVIAALASVRARGNPWYALVFIWALVAIAVRGGSEADSVMLAAQFGVGLMVLALAIGLARAANRRHWLGV